MPRAPGALAVARAGGKVIVNDLDREVADEVIAEIKAFGGDRADWIDLSQTGMAIQAGALVEETIVHLKSLCEGRRVV